MNTNRYISIYIYILIYAGCIHRMTYFCVARIGHWWRIKWAPCDGQPATCNDGSDSCRAIRAQFCKF